MMTTSQAISNGLCATWRNKWMVVVFFACNLLMAAAIAAPMHAAIADHIGNSMVGEQLARGFDWGWLTEFQIAQQTFLKSFSTAVVYGSVLFLILNTLLSAGAFELFRQCIAVEGEGSPVQTFGRGMGKFFLRFARVVVVASVLYYVAFWFWQGPVASGLDRAFQDSAVERWHFYLNWLRLTLMFATVFAVNVVVDYAKTDLVIDDHASALGAIGHAAGFIWVHVGRVVAIYLAFGMLSGVTILLYAAFARYFPQSSVGTVFVWFIVAQLLIWVRWMFRVASWGAAIAYYADRRKSDVAATAIVTQVEA